MSLYLLGLHSHVRCHVILDSSAGQARIAPQVLRVIQVLQGVPGQGVGRLSVQWLPLLRLIEQRTPLGLWRMWGQIRLHVVFGEGKARPGDPVRARAAETGQRSGAGRVFVIVVGAEHFASVSVVEAFGGEVDAGSSGSAAHHAGHVELRVVG